MNSSHVKSTRPKAIALGISPDVLKYVNQALPDVELVVRPMEIPKLLREKDGESPDMAFCGDQKSNVSLIEVAQAIRSLYSEVPLFYVSTNRHSVDRESLKRAGFTDALLIPLDLGVLTEALPFGGAQTEFREVPLVDISPDTVLSFDTYLFLPMNNRFVRFSSAGHQLEAKRAQRLLSHEVANVHVAKEQIEKFYAFTAEQLKKINNGSGEIKSETERRERLKRAVRSLFANVLTHNAEPMECSEIVNAYILSQAKAEHSWYEKVLRLSGANEESYGHVSNVATMASLLSIGLGIGNVEEIALAGMLHDIGLADVPSEIQAKEENERSSEEQILYQRHPIISVEILKDKQLPFSENVFKYIEQHHERPDGSGYPCKLKDISLESQLVGIAEEFAELTEIKPGRPRCTARDALGTIFSMARFDSQLLHQIRQLLGLEEKAAA